MDMLDLALRGAAIAVLALVSLQLSRAPIDLEGRVSIFAVSVAMTAYLLITTAIPLQFPPLVEANLILLSSLVPNAITWMIVTIFLDPPWRRWPWLVFSSIAAASFYVHQIAPDFGPGLICLPIAIALYGSLVGLALWTSRDDLVECRCRARPGFAIAIAGLALTLTAAEALGAMEAQSQVLALVKSVGTLALSMGFAIWILRPDAALWPGGATGTSGARRSGTPSRSTPAGTDIDAALIARIEAAMSEGIWREEGLTIGALAHHLAVPEHRLRRAINHGLGHRNFSSFINHARIEAACAALSDPARHGTTVLEIAYDVGFASLGPFNRAFRAETGLSPTEYRRDAHQAGPADSAQNAPIPANLH